MWGLEKFEQCIHSKNSVYTSTTQRPRHTIMCLDLLTTTQQLSGCYDCMLRDWMTITVTVFLIFNIPERIVGLAAFFLFFSFQKKSGPPPTSYMYMYISIWVCILYVCIYAYIRIQLQHYYVCICTYLIIIRILMVPCPPFPQPVVLSEPLSQVFW